MLQTQPEHQLFTAERLPRKPYCSDDKTASRFRSLEIALNYTHIQFNPPSSRYWLVFDLDFDGRRVPLTAAQWHYEEVLAPTPNIIVTNPENGHAHYYYALKTPVVRGENGRRGPQAFANAVYRGLGAKLGADPLFTQLMGRNPLHPHHITHYPRSEPYELAELDEYVWDRIAGTEWIRKARDISYVVDPRGRNCTLFEKLRRWAYLHVDDYLDDGKHWSGDFESECLEKALEFNDFREYESGALSFNEVRSIARSVSRWVLKNYSSEYSGRSEDFLDLQAARGRKKGAVKRAELLPRVLELVESGVSHRQIAAQLGIDHKTVGNWLRRAEKEGWGKAYQIPATGEGLTGNQEGVDSSSGGGSRRHSEGLSLCLREGAKPHHQEGCNQALEVGSVNQRLH